MVYLIVEKLIKQVEFVSVIINSVVSCCSRYHVMMTLKSLHEAIRLGQLKQIRHIPHHIHCDNLFCFLISVKVVNESKGSSFELVTRHYQCQLIVMMTMLMDYRVIIVSMDV